MIAGGGADRRNHRIAPPLIKTAERWQEIAEKNKENRKKSDKCLAVLGIPSTFVAYEDAQGCVFVVET